jgi:hypothetical protein
MKHCKQLTWFLGLLLSALLSSTLAHAETGVYRSSFTTAIENKEPVSELDVISSDTPKVYFFTELRGLEGHTVTHRWEYSGETMAEVSFNIGGDRWRTWSSKNMLPAWSGVWEVSVLDEGGNIMMQKSFEFADMDSMNQSDVAQDSENTDTE